MPGPILAAMQRNPIDPANESGATAAETRINGIDLRALKDVSQSEDARPGNGPHRFEAHSRWLDGMHTSTTVNGFSAPGGEQHVRMRPFVLESDLPPLFLGEDRGIDPLEFLLTAVGASLTTALVWQASILGIHLDAVDVHVEGDIDLAGSFGGGDRASTGFRRIRVTAIMEADVSHAVLEDLLKIATRHSPVINTVGQGVSIQIDTVAAAKPEWSTSHDERAGGYR